MVSLVLPPAMNGQDGPVKIYEICLEHLEHTGGCETVVAAMWFGATDAPQTIEICVVWGDPWPQAL